MCCVSHYKCLDEEDANSLSSFKTHRILTAACRARGVANTKQNDQEGGIRKNDQEGGIRPLTL